MEFAHIPVMGAQCIEALDIKPQGVYVDSTTGGAGHSAMIAQRLTSGRLICIDRDGEALAVARERLAAFAPRVLFVKSNFECVKDVIHEQNIEGVDGILFDFGVSSYQLANPARGFAYKEDGPLDMRMDAEQALSAHEVVNTYSQERLRDIIGFYGEERYAGRIASAITAARDTAPIETTHELVEIIKRAMPPQAKREKQHPAKRTFQAIRMEVNGELSAIERAVRGAIDALNPGGRVVTISFHSLEDRLVKRLFAQAAAGCVCPKSFPVCTCGRTPEIKLVTRGVVVADEQELAQNPRARSAKMRAAQKL